MDNRGGVAPTGLLRWPGLLLAGVLMLLAGLVACTPGGPASGPPGGAPPETPAGAPTTPPGAMIGPARLVFAEDTHDFGEVSSKGPTIEYRFPFTNNGSSPLEISPLRLEPAPGGSCT